MRTKWTMRISNGDGGEHVLTVTAPPGTGKVQAYVGGLRFSFAPKDMSKLQRICREAQAAALFDRGAW